MSIIAHGRLQHHFWGEYSADIVLAFANAALAAQALPKLPGFHVHSNPKYANVLTVHAGGNDLKGIEDMLVAMGANRKKMGSIAKSIDYGEPFTIAVNLAPPDPPCYQGDLFD